MKLTVTLIVTAVITFSSFHSAAAPLLVGIDDNGTASFVRQIVPKLLGRKAKGTLEVNLLSDIADQFGRGAVVQALMEQPEFVTHWSAVLIDHLKMQRHGPGQKIQSPQCFPDPQSSPYLQSGSDDLAAFVRDSAITSDYSANFNMTDLIVSSIHLDNLFPIYRGNLFALGAHPPGSSMRTDAEVRAEIGTQFDDTYLNRDMQCISCHRGTYSTTGIGDRTHPLYETLELSIFDALQQGDVSPVQNDDYETYCESCHGSKATGVVNVGPPIRDFSYDAIIAVLKNPGEIMKSSEAFWGQILDGDTDEDEARISDLAAAISGPFGGPRIGDTSRWHFGGFRPDLFQEKDNDGDEPAYAIGDGWGPWRMSLDCAEIIGEASDPAIEAYFAGHASNFTTVIDIDEKFRSGFDQLKGSLGVMPLFDSTESIPGEIAASYMLAATITENVWKTLMGERLTLVNRFSRNEHQRDLHKYLTEEIFIENDWSLKALIQEILSTNYFNRSAPRTSFASGPYTLDPVYDPFAQTGVDCRDDDSHRNDSGINDYKVAGGSHKDERDIDSLCIKNGQGDAVHQYSPRSLLSSVAAAMDWSEPKIFADDAAYPDIDFVRGIGQYLSDFHVGQDQTGFQPLLHWDNEVGTCSNPDGDASEDWIDRVHAGIDEFNDAHPEQPLTIWELVLTIKDWLLQEPELFGDDTEMSEIQLVHHFLGDINLNLPVSTDTVSQDTLRELCGVYVKSPQFMLAGIIRNGVYDPPRLRVCNDGSCSYQSMCMEYKPALKNLGYPIMCHKDSVGESPLSADPEFQCTDCNQPQSTSGISVIGDLIRKLTRG